jgi:hypothetical protein
VRAERRARESSALQGDDAENSHGMRMPAYRFDLILRESAEDPGLERTVRRCGDAKRCIFGVRDASRFVDDVLQDRR